jgi:hypothetical protein
MALSVRTSQAIAASYYIITASRGGTMDPAFAGEVIGSVANDEAILR